MNRRNLLAALAASLAYPRAASAEYMTEAERRAQMTALAEGRRFRRAADPAQGWVDDGAPARREETLPADGLPDGSRHAQAEPGTIFISTGDRVLHFVAGGGQVLTWRIAVGREGAQWKGVTHVTHKRKNPEWRPTPNMRRRDPKLPLVVAPGPKNPLGVRAIYLAEGYLRIHGTNAPSSIGTAASSGCFRMLNEDVTELYELVQTGAAVHVLD